jgi:hypothetical protein
VGDVTAEQAFAGAERAFGKWARVEIADVKPAELPAPTRRVVVIDRPGAVQTEIRVGHLGLPRKHKDFLALDLALKILGGEGGNRLHRVLRSERGLTYGAEADVNALKDAGDIVASTDTRSDTTAEALRLIVDEIAKLRRERVHPRELGDAQAYLTGSFPLTIETPGAIALQVLNAVVYGLDLEELQTYRERVNSITPDDIQRVAQQYLYPDRLSIVLVGDANVFAKQLPAVGFDKIERIPLSQLDLTSPDLRAPSRSGPPRGERDPSASTPGLLLTGYSPAPSSVQTPGPTADTRALIERAIAAKGGRVLLQSIRTVKSASDMVFATPSGEARVKTTAYVRYPGQFRVDAEGPDGLRIQTFDNGSAWVGDGKEFEDAPPAVVKFMEAGVQRDTVALLLALAERRVPCRRIADVDVDGTAMPALEADLKSAGRVTLVFHPTTGLLTSQRYGGEAGEPATEEKFSDYRPMQGVLVAYRATVRREKNPPFQRIVRTFEINVPIEPTFFDKPSTKL